MRVNRAIAGALLTATLATAAMPASAQRWHRGGHYRHGDRIDAGDVLLGAILLGGIIGIARSADRDRDRREAERYEPEPDYPRPEYRTDAPDAGPDTGPDTGYAEIHDADEAADACAAAAEDEGRRHARLASVGTIQAVDSVGGGWVVRGLIGLRDSYRENGGDHPFRCSIAGATAPVVRIEGYTDGQ